MAFVTVHRADPDPPPILKVDLEMSLTEAKALREHLSVTMPLFLNDAHPLERIFHALVRGGV